MENAKIDLRKIPQKDLQRLKRNAIKLRSEGMSNKEVAHKFNLNPVVLSRWYQKYLQNDGQVKILKRGRKQGTHKKLTIEQEDMIIRELQQFSNLLDKTLVKKIIEKLCKIQMPLTTISDYLKEWGINSAPIEKYENSFIKNFGVEDFKLIRKGMAKRRSVIIWIVIVDCKAAGKKHYAILTRSIKNKLVFKIYEKQVQSEDIAKFVSQLAKFFAKDLYIVLEKKYIKGIDNFTFHNAEKITFIDG